MDIVPVIARGAENVWITCPDHEPLFAEVGAPHPPNEHLAFIRDGHGEMLVATEGSEVVGWVGLVPLANSEAVELAGIGVHRDYRRRGIGRALLAQAVQWVSESRGVRLTFQTSPLLTGNAMLYVRRFNARYTYRDDAWADPDQTVKWPVVDASIDVHDTDYAWRGAPDGGPPVVDLLSWDGSGTRPVADVTGIASPAEAGEPLPSVVRLRLPELSLPTIIEQLQAANLDICNVPAKAFEAATAAGYAITGYEPAGDGSFAYLLARGQ